MHWWSVKKLADRLAVGELDSAAQFAYLIGFVIFELFSWAVDTIPWRAPELANPIGAILLLLKLAGPLVCFFANGGQRGRSFIVRYVALSFPARIQACFWLLVGLFPLAALVGFTRGALNLPTTWTVSVLAVPYFFLGLNVIQFGLVFRYLRKLANSQAKGNPRGSGVPTGA